MRPKFIKYIEKKEGIFLSDIKVDEEVEIKKLNDKNYTLVYTSSGYVKNKIEWVKKIYKTNHPFYLFFERNILYDDKEISSFDDKATLTIYHEPNKINELNFFLKQFTNALKNKN